jgi:hypothetical protein
MRLIEKLAAAACSVVVTLALSGCATPTWFEKSWKTPVDKRLQEETVSQTLKAFNEMGTPNVLASVSLPAVEPVILANLKDEGVVNLSLTGDDQVLRIDAKFKRHFTRNDLAESERPKYPDFNILVQGQIAAHGYAAISHDDSKNELAVRLKPAVVDVKVQKIRINGAGTANILEGATTLLLNVLKGKITEELGKQPLLNVKLHAAGLDSAAIAKTLTGLLGDGSNVTVQPFGPAVRLWRAMYIVDSDRLTVTANVLPGEAPNPAYASKPVNKFDDLIDRLAGITAEEFDAPESEDDYYVLVQKRLPADIVNYIAAKGAVCGNASVLSKKFSFSEKITLPNGSDLSCKKSVECGGPSPCKFSYQQDTRNCYRCLVPSPKICTKWFGKRKCVGGGGCITKGDDPVCVAAREGQNAINLAAANTSKAACDARVATEVAACQSKAAAEKALCDTGRTALQAIAQNGDFARISGNVDIDAAGVKACLRELTIAPDLKTVNVKVEATGAAKVKLDATYTPLNVVGTLTCLAPWGASQTFAVSTRGLLETTGSITERRAKEGELGLDYGVKTKAVPLTVSPSPLKLILDNKDMQLKCTAAWLAQPLLIAIAPALPLLPDSMDFPIKDIKGQLNVSIPAVQIPGAAEHKPEVRLTDKAIMVSGDIKVKTD